MATPGSALSPTGLLCELMAHPERVPICNSRPRFGWIVNGTSPDAVQAAYQILVATDLRILVQDEADVWDSGKVESEQCIGVRYAGPPLAPNTSFCWKVRTWNARGQESPYSEPRSFRTGDLGREHASTRYPLEAHEIAPVRVAAKDKGHYFIEFAKAAFGTLVLDLPPVDAACDLRVVLGEKQAGPDAVWRQEHGGVVGGGPNITSFETTMHWDGRAGKRVLPLPARSSPGAAPLPEGIEGILPFRFCEIVGLSAPITVDSVRQLAVFYPFDDEAAHFTSSDRVLNDVWDLCKYSMKATSALGVYIDGQRERIPYEADAYINQLGHYCCDREFTLARFSHEFLITHPTWPTEWILHSVLMAWADYMHTGDTASLEQFYPDLQAKALTVLAREDGLISVQTGLATDDVLESIHFSGELRDVVDWPHGERDEYNMVAVNTVVNSFHYRALVLMARTADTLDKADDAVGYRQRADGVRAAIHEKLLDQSQGIFLDGEGSEHASLHANMFPLAFGLVPEEYRDHVVSFVKSRGMACSVYAAQYLLESLYRADEQDYALSLMTSTAERSWAHMIYDVGTTISLEAWDHRFKPNQDWNHAWGAAPANIIPRWLIGVRPLEPGFRKILIQPRIGSLTHAEMALPTVRGSVHVRVDNPPDGPFTLRVTIPANTSACVALPQLGSADPSVSVDGEASLGTLEDPFVVIDPVGSGDHTFVRQRQTTGGPAPTT